jgi:ABC-type transporter Mla subunit MlaD
MIGSRKGSIEASAEQLPQILGHAGAVLVRVERVLADENLRALSDTLANIERASRELPATMQDARQLSADLRRVAESTAELTARMNESFGKAQPGLEATMENARIASERLARTADSLDRLLNGNDGAFGRTATASVAELQQLVIDARSASIEVRELARTLRERPSGLLLEPQPSGVEIKR